MGINSKTDTVLRRAGFLDRDGGINDTVDRGENFFVKGKQVRWTAPYSYGEFKFKSGVAESLKKFGELGFLRIIVTNQPDVKYGFISKKEYDLIMSDLQSLPLDDIFVCLHARDDGCECRKPKPGMIVEAAKKWGIDLGKLLMIGDAEIDMDAGKAVGLRTILMDYEHNKDVAADVRVKNLSEAVKYIKTI